MSEVVVLDAAAVAARCPPARAVDAIISALQEGLEPSSDLARTVIPVQHGQLLLMPSTAAEGLAAAAGGDHLGVKVATVAPANPEAGLPRIQGTYLLFERHTLSLAAIIDGAALTELRTPAVSVAAISPVLRRRTSPISLVVVGAGPQAVGHVRALRSWLGSAQIVDVRYLVRDPGHVDRAASNPAQGCSASDRVPPTERSRARTSWSARPPHASRFSTLGSSATRRSSSRSARTNRTLARSTRPCWPGPWWWWRIADTACREAGDVVQAIAEGAIAPSDLVTMKALIDGSVAPPSDRPVLFKSVGMSWEDLVVTGALVAG